MNKEELLELVENLEELYNYCNTITSGNISQRIPNVQQCVLSIIEFLKFKIENQ